MPWKREFPLMHVISLNCLGLQLLFYGGEVLGGFFGHCPLTINIFE